MIKLSINSNFKILLVFLFFSFLVLIFGNFFYQTVTRHELDTAFLLEILTNTFRYSMPISQIFGTAIDGFLVALKAGDLICTSPLKPEHFIYSPFDNHAYYALFILAPLLNFFTAEAVLSYFHAIVFLATPFLAFYFLLKRDVSFFYASIFSFLIISYPGWSHAAVGNYYMDRFYPPFILLTLILLDFYNKGGFSKNFQLGAILALAIISALFSERGAIMVGYALIGFTFINWNSKNQSYKSKLFLIIVGILSIFYAYLYLKFRFIDLFPGDTARDTANFISKIFKGFERYSTNEVQDKFISFLITNFGFLGILALFSGWKNILFVLGAMLPNLVVTTGGAEFNGWSTHYHATYFSFLVYGSCLGLVWLSNNKIYLFKKITLLLILIVCLMSSLIYDPYLGKFHLPDIANYRTGVVGRLIDYYIYPQTSYDRLVAENALTIQGMIPEGSSVSTLDGMFPSLYKNRVLYMYPTGWDTADYLILHNKNNNLNSVSVTGASNYNGEAKLINECMNNRLNDLGLLDRDRLRLFNEWVIIKRN